jgi:PPOX class probable F420-dependent enzyme
LSNAIMRSGDGGCVVPESWGMVHLGWGFGGFEETIPRAKSCREPPSARVEESVLSDRERLFLDRRRVGHLATADGSGVPHVVPVCYALRENTLYIAVDEKPKRPGALLKRLRNIDANAAVAVVVDRYDENWARLGWVMLRGRAEILTEGPEHEDAQALVRSRYEQLRAMRIETLPVIAVRIERATSWGDLSVAEET